MQKRKQMLAPGEIIPLNFDFLFTSIFNNPDNMVIIENFLAIYFDIPLSTIRGKVIIKSRDLLPNAKIDADKQVDLLLDYEGEKINIELSNYNSPGLIDRNIVYLASVHSHQMEYGVNNYAKIGKSLQIIFNNFACNHGELKRTYYLKNEDGEVLSEKLQVDIIDIVAGVKMWYTNCENKLANLCKMLVVNNMDELESVLKEVMEMNAKEKLVKEVKKFSADDANIGLYTKLSHQEILKNTLVYEAEERGRIEGEKKGITEGEKRGIVLTAKKMLENGIDIEIIKKITGLSLMEIEKLKSN